MYNIAFVTNKKAPYRKLQIEKIAENKLINVSVFYIDKDIMGRKWDVGSINGASETKIPIIPFVKLNKGLLNIIKSNDLIIIGGYEKLTYFLLSIISRIIRKPYVLLFDGISPKKIHMKENFLKYTIKRIVINRASAIFGNGEVSKKYFSDKFGYPTEKIFNQYLTIDVEKIASLSKNKQRFRKEFRNKYKISSNKRVILYSGRLIKRKNIEVIIKSLSINKNRDNYLLLIIGDGEEKKNIIEFANSNGVDIRVTGFIQEQEELFRHYFIGDLLILPSYNEPWGLVVNEAMAAGLPVIVSTECGSYLDLINLNFNGNVFEPNDYRTLSEKIDYIFNNEVNVFGENSLKIIKKWTFESSKESFEKMVISIMEKNRGSISV